MSTRAPPPRQRQQSNIYTMTPRAVQRSLRPIVLVASLVNGVISLVYGIGAFRDLNTDKDHGFPKLGTLDIVLGAIYCGVFLLEAIGVVAAAMNTVRWCRVFAFVSIAGGLGTVGAAVVRVFVHYSYKSDLINECVALTSGEDIEYRFGIWGTTVKDNLTPEEAQHLCQKGYNSDATSEIINLVIQCILAVLTIYSAWAYYQQVLDPSLTRKVAPVPDYENVGTTYPARYNPPYAGASEPLYAPPPGPPPGAFKNADAGGYGGYGGYEPPTLGYSQRVDKDDPFADFDEAVGKGGNLKGASESREALV